MAIHGCVEGVNEEFFDCMELEDAVEDKMELYEFKVSTSLGCAPLRGHHSCSLCMFFEQLPEGITLVITAMLNAGDLGRLCFTCSLLWDQTESFACYAAVEQHRLKKPCLAALRILNALPDRDFNSTKFDEVISVSRTSTWEGISSEDEDEQFGSFDG